MNVSETPPVELRGIVLNAIARITDQDVANLSSATELAPLGIDSLGLAGLILDVEDDLGTELSIDTLARVANAEVLATVGDLLAALGWRDQA